MTGGLDLAFELAGGKIIAMCEIEPFCQKVLKKHWPDVPLYPDIKDLKGEDLVTDGKKINIIIGEPPCQPVSVAAHVRKGKDDDRWLWDEYTRLVREIKPDWLVAENVPGLISKGLDGILSTLEVEGYGAGTFDYEALAVGAHHKRERVFIVAHARRVVEGMSYTGSTSSESRAQNAPYPPVPDTFEGLRRAYQSRVRGVADGLSAGMDRSSGGGLDWGMPEPTKYGVVNGSKRLKALGNAVVPQQAYPIFKAILAVENGWCASCP